MKNHDQEPFRWDLARNTFCVPEFRLLYLATPKVACTAWKWWVAELAGISRETIIQKATYSRESLEALLIHDGIERSNPHIQSFDLQQMQAQYANPDLFRFALVRNPYTRIFSAWASKVLLAETGQVNAGESLPVPQNTHELAQAFENFLGEIETREYPDAWINSHWVPQSLWLDLPGVPFSHVYAIEKMDVALAEIGEHVHRQGGVSPSLRRFNETVLPWQPRFMTETARRRIIHLYREDFSRFAYAPETVPGTDNIADETVEGILAAIPHIQARQRRIDALFHGWKGTEEEKVRWMGQAEIQRLQREHEHEAQMQVIEQYRQSAQTAEQRMAMMEASRSWRMTQPLRRLMAIFRSGQGTG